jgi:hypothetical protein
MFVRSERTDLQGTCTTTPYYDYIPRTVTGLGRTAAEQDEFPATRGDFPAFNNEYACAQHVITYNVDLDLLADNAVLSGSVSDVCSTATYHVTRVPGISVLFALVENAYDADHPAGYFPLQCKVLSSLAQPGGYEIVNGTCADESSGTAESDRSECPARTRY